MEEHAGSDLPSPQGSVRSPRCWWAYWEEHCEKHVKKGGFVAVPDWLSVYWNEKLKTLLAIYVDDFKMAGPKDIKTDEPAKAGK